MLTSFVYCQAIVNAKFHELLNAMKLGLLVKDSSERKFLPPNIAFGVIFVGRILCNHFFHIAQNASSCCQKAKKLKGIEIYLHINTKKP
jgi:hypothetical protein